MEAAAEAAPALRPKDMLSAEVPPVAPARQGEPAPVPPVGPVTAPAKTPVAEPAAPPIDNYAKTLDIDDFLQAPPVPQGAAAQAVSAQREGVTLPKGLQQPTPPTPQPGTIPLFGPGSDPRNPVSGSLREEMRPSPVDNSARTAPLTTKAGAEYARVSDEAREILKAVPNVKISGKPATAKNLATVLADFKAGRLSDGGIEFVNRLRERANVARGNVPAVAAVSKGAEFQRLVDEWVPQYPKYPAGQQESARAQRKLHLERTTERLINALDDAGLVKRPSEIRGLVGKHLTGDAAATARLQEIIGEMSAKQAPGRVLPTPVAPKDTTLGLSDDLVDATDDELAAIEASMRAEVDPMDASRVIDEHLSGKKQSEKVKILASLSGQDPKTVAALLSKEQSGKLLPAEESALIALKQSAAYGLNADRLVSGATKVTEARKMIRDFSSSKQVTDDAAKAWLTERGMNWTPKNIDFARESVRLADESLTVAAKVPDTHVSAASISDAVLSSAQQEKMKVFLASVARMVGQKTNDLTNMVRTDGKVNEAVDIHAFDHWVDSGLDEITDVHGYVTLPTRGRTSQVKASDLKSWNRSLVAIREANPTEVSALTSKFEADTLGTGAVEYLTDLKSIFDEKIVSGTLSPKQVSSRKIANVLSAVRHLTANHRDTMERMLGTDVTDYLVSALGSEAKFAQRFAVVQKALAAKYTDDDLRNLLRVHGPNTKPVFNELGLGPQVTRFLDDANDPSLAAQRPVDAPTPVGTQSVAEPEIVAPSPAPAPAAPVSVDPVPALVHEAAENASVSPVAPGNMEGFLANLDRISAQVDADDMVDVSSMALDAIRKTVGSEIDVLSKAPYTTKTGAQTMDPKGTEYAYRRLFNQKTQAKLFSNLWTSLVKRSEIYFRNEGKPFDKLTKAPGDEVTRVPMFFDRAIYTERMALDSANEIDRFMDAMGIPQVIGLGDELVPMSFGDILRTFHQYGQEVFGDGARFVRPLLMFNGSSRGLPDLIMGAVAAAVKGASPEEVASILRTTQNTRKTTTGKTKTGMEGAKDLPNHFAEPSVRVTIVRPNVVPTWERDVLPYFPNAKFVSNGKTGTSEAFWLEIPGEDLTQAMTGMITGLQHRLGAVAAHNGLGAQARAANDFHALTAEGIARLDALLALPDGGVSFMQAVRQIPQTVADSGLTRAAYQDTIDAATAALRTSVGDDAVTSAEALGKIDAVATGASRPVTKGKKKAVSEKTLAGTVEASNRTAARTTIKEGERQKAEEMAALMGAGQTDNLLRDADEALKTGGKVDDEATIEALRDQSEMYDLSAPLTADVQGVTKNFLYRAGQAFDKSFGHKSLYDITHDKQGVANAWLGNLHKRLTTLAKAAGPETVQAAWQVLKHGGKGTPEAEAITEEFSRILSNLWGANTDSFVGNAFFRTEGDIDYINEVIAQKYKYAKGAQVPAFDVGKAKERAKAVDKSNWEQTWPEHLAGQWREWDFVDADPLDFISRMSDAAATLAERRAIVESALYRFEKWGLTSKTPKPGYVKIANTPRSSFAHFLTRDTTGAPREIYIEKSVAQELHYADVLTKMPRQLDGEVGQFLRKTYIPVQNAWKFAITVLRPGHHMRNLMGNNAITWISRGNAGFTRATTDAFKVLAVHGKYDDVDFIRALQSLDASAGLPTGGEVLLRGSLNGEAVELTNKAVFEIMQRKGLLPSFHMGEGLFDDAVLASRTARVSRAVTLQDTKVGVAAGRVSQAVDHHGRAQHLLQILHQELGAGKVWRGKKQYPGVKNLEDLIERAALEVKKFHPDASMLTPFESSKMRPIFPFYSWFSKIIPAIFESTLRHPGRVMMIPKAQYNTAVAMGINPDSLADPFPEDQMFPSFVDEKLTGTTLDGEFLNTFGMGANPADLYTLSLGVPHIDIANMLGTDPFAGVVGMISPLIRMGPEMYTQTTATGAKIQDMSDYVDGNIPLVGALSNMLGTSITGTLASPLFGKPGLDPQYQVTRENKGGFGSSDSILSALSFMTGIGISNVTRPNYQNLAEIEERNQSRDDANARSPW